MIICAPYLRIMCLFCILAFNIKIVTHIILPHSYQHCICLFPNDENVMGRHAKCGLSYILLSPLLKHINHCLWSHKLFSFTKYSVSADEFFNRGNYFCIDQCNDTFLFHMYFHVRYHFIRLPLNCHLYESQKNGLEAGRFNLCCHTNLHLLLWVNIIK